MVSQVDDFDTIVTDSEFEALVLECSLIKQYSPKYNILLKDDKGYHYIRVSPGPWAKISEWKGNPPDDGARYIGPFLSFWAVREAVDEAARFSCCLRVTGVSRRTWARDGRASITLSNSAARPAGGR